jgi:hypothetical protein
MTCYLQFQMQHQVNVQLTCQMMVQRIPTITDVVKHLIHISLKSFLAGFRVRGGACPNGASTACLNVESAAQAHVQIIWRPSQISSQNSPTTCPSFIQYRF